MAKSKTTQENITEQTEQEALESTQEATQKSEQASQEATSAESSTPSEPQNEGVLSTPNTNEGFKDFNTRLNAALDSSVEWREQMRLSLQAIQEVYIAF